MEEEVIMQDQDVTVLAPKKAIVKGHLVIIPNKTSLIMELVENRIISKMFQVANKLSSILFDNLQCKGTNILIQNGVPAGQTNNTFSINVIPRFENDGLKLEWQPKQSNESELNNTLQKFEGLDKEEVDKKIIQDKKKKIQLKKENEIKGDKNNYLIKSLDRLP